MKIIFIFEWSIIDICVISDVFVLILPTAMSIKCFSCIGIIDTKCESRTTEVECHPTGQLIYDSCYTVTKIMDYPLIGRRVELLKNCSVLAHCGFLEQLECDNHYGLIDNCSIQCCTGDLCNNETYQYNTTSVTREKVTRTVTRAITTNEATRAPELTSAISMTSSEISTTTDHERALTSWTSETGQVAIFSSAIPTIEPAVKVNAISGDAKRILVQPPVLMLMVILGSGISYERL